MANYINPFTDIGFKRIFGQGWMNVRMILIVGFMY